VLATGNPPCTIGAYYLTDASGDSPLFQFYVLADDPHAPAKLADAAIRLAKQMNIRGLDNAQSPMRGNLLITLLKVELEPNPIGGPPSIHPVRDTRDGRIADWKIGEHFQIRITNQTDTDLYAAALMLGSSGSIELLSSNPHGDLIRSHTSTVMHSPRDVGLPLGIETYKVIATTSGNVDFRTLEQSGGSKEAVGSPLEWLINQTTNTLSRGSPTQNVELGGWATASVDIRIVPAK